MCSRAKKLRLISQNPCTDVGKLNERRDRRQAKPLSYEEEMRIQKFSPPWFATLVTLLADTGLRVRREAIPLKWSDVELDSPAPCIYIRNSKTEAGIRTVWLTEHCRVALARWRTLMGPDFSPFVFPSPRIPGAHVADYKNAWKKATKDAGVFGRRIYDLRATFASRANAAHATSLTLAHLLGHSSTTILPTYTKPIDENTRAVIGALDEARTKSIDPRAAIQ
jgi:integrase